MGRKGQYSYMMVTGHVGKVVKVGVAQQTIDQARTMVVVLCS